MNNPLAIGFALAVMIVAIGGLAYSGYLGKLAFPGTATSSVAASRQSAGGANAPAGCAEDTLLCANGSIVGRVAPACDFAACPGDSSRQNASPVSASGSGAASGDSASVFSARIGEGATFSGTVVTLASLVEDSRCPDGAQCIQAGTVRVSVRIQKGIFATTQTFILGVPVTFAGITGELIEVSPRKRVGENIPLSGYRFTFRVAGF